MTVNNNSRYSRTGRTRADDFQSQKVGCRTNRYHEDDNTSAEEANYRSESRRERRCAQLDTGAVTVPACTTARQLMSDKERHVAYRRTDDPELRRTHPEDDVEASSKLRGRTFLTTSGRFEGGKTTCQMSENPSGWAKPSRRSVYGRKDEVTAAERGASSRMDGRARVNTGNSCLLYTSPSPRDS